MAENLTMEKFFSLIDDSEYVFEAQRSIEEYVPRRLYKFYSIPSNLCEREKRFMQLEEEKIWFSKKKILNDPFEMEHLSLHTASHEAQEYYERKIPELEFFCLTNSPLNKLMWSHYADAYKGYCVEFYVDSPGWIQPVIYENARPDLSECYQRFYDKKEELNFSGLNNDQISKDILRLDYPLISKDICWSYENEYRIIFSTPADGSKGHLYSARNFELAISKVIVGAHCPKKNIKKLKKAVANLNRKRYERQRQLVMSSDINIPPEKIDAITQEIWAKALPRNARVEIKMITWNSQLELIETDLMEDNFSESPEI